MSDSDQNFELFSDSDRNKISYGACLAGWTATGAVVGGIHGGVVLSLPASVIGAAGGVAWGLLTCRRLAPVIRWKLERSGLLGQRSELTERELVEALKAVRDLRPGVGKAEAINLLAAARQEIARNPGKYQLNA